MVLSHSSFNKSLIVIFCSFQVGDLPEAEVAPPENVLFVCKLNPVTTAEDLEIIFSRFGKIVSCDVIKVGLWLSWIGQNLRTYDIHSNRVKLMFNRM